VSDCAVPIDETSRLKDPSGKRARAWPPEANMLDWLTRPADWLLSAGGVVASWFFSKDAVSFTVVQMMFATLMLAAFLSLIIFWKRWLNIGDRIGKPADREQCQAARKIGAQRLSAATPSTVNKNYLPLLRALGKVASVGDLFFWLQSGWP
jgi:hypothetical protein